MGENHAKNAAQSGNRFGHGGDRCGDRGHDGISGRGGQSHRGCDGITWYGDDGTDQIYVAETDGASRVEISTAGTGTDPTLNHDPQWSPDGTRIAWSGDDGATAQIWTADTDGGSRDEISSADVDPDADPTANSRPQWSPGGTRIAWSGDDGATAQIWTADADGATREEISAEAVVVPDPTMNVTPQWSLDGIRVAWSGLDGTSGTEQIWIAQTDGTPRNLISTVSAGTDPTANVDPQGSPDSTRIMWSGHDGASNQIYVADFGGANRIDISSVDTGPTLNFAPQWSPDGSRIVWEGDGLIYVADADGGSRIEISAVGAGTDPTGNGSPQWSPDGTRIAWSGDDGDSGTNQIYVADADGMSRVLISTVSAGTDPTANFAPQWSPNPADLSVSVVVDDATPEVGTEIEATVTVSNDGPCDAVGVMVSGLSLPCTTDLVGEPTAIVDGVATVGALADGAMSVFFATGTVTDLGDCTTDLTVSGYTPDVDPSVDTATLAVVPECTIADLAVLVVLDDTTPVVTTDVEATVTVSNEGPCDVADAEVSGLSLPCADPLVGDPFAIVGGTAAVGAVASGESAMFTATGTITVPGACAGVLTVSSSQTDLDGSNDTAPMSLTAAGCGLVVSASPDDPNPGLSTEINATVTVTKHRGLRRGRRRGRGAHLAVCDDTGRRADADRRWNRIVRNPARRDIGGPDRHRNDHRHRGLCHSADRHDVDSGHRSRRHHALHHSRRVRRRPDTVHRRQRDVVRIGRHFVHLRPRHHHRHLGHHLQPRRRHHPRTDGRLPGPPLPPSGDIAHPMPPPAAGVRSGC